MALAGHVSRAMMEVYFHVRMEGKRGAVDSLSEADFAVGRAQYSVSEKPEKRSH
jgi:hypothetical protein